LLVAQEPQHCRSDNQGGDSENHWIGPKHAHDDHALSLQSGRSTYLLGSSKGPMLGQTIPAQGVHDGGEPIALRESQKNDGQIN
jgi:hypothetical protein